MEPGLPVEEITDLSGEQPQWRALVRAAFTERLGDIAVATEFHRLWNGGWRCRATAAGRPPLEFALLRVAGVVLVALPVPMPAGWQRRGVAGSDGARYGADAEGVVHRLSP